MEKAKGQLFVVAAPSGGGKTSLIKAILAELDTIMVSISHTTRPMRPGEVDGVDYFFVNEATFVEMINASAFVEHARVFNHYYGTSVQQIADRLQDGIDIVLDIDWQGAAQIRHLFADAISIFVLPPALHVLEERLQNRKQDDLRVIRKRMQQAKDEMQHYGEFDYLVVNDNFMQAVAELKAIIVAQRLKTARQSVQQKKLLSFLLTGE
ncbi:MAG: guanylate kinase [Legionellaceae bacterium]|nr:guanylate kinase [Legionellaceae bacterium]